MFCSKKSLGGNKNWFQGEYHKLHSVFVVMFSSWHFLTDVLRNFCLSRENVSQYSIFHDIFVCLGRIFLWGEYFMIFLSVQGECFTILNTSRYFCVSRENHDVLYIMIHLCGQGKYSMLYVVFCCHVVLFVDIYLSVGKIFYEFTIFFVSRENILWVCDRP